MSNRALLSSLTEDADDIGVVASSSSLASTNDNNNANNDSNAIFESSSTLSYTVSNHEGIASPVGEDFMRIDSFSFSSDCGELLLHNDDTTDGCNNNNNQELFLSLDLIQDPTNAVRSSSTLHAPQVSFASLYSNVSTSANTALISNAGKELMPQGGRGKRSKSPPRYILGDEMVSMEQTSQVGKQQHQQQQPQHHQNNENNHGSKKGDDDENNKRSIFGNQAQKKYNVRRKNAKSALVKGIPMQQLALAEEEYLKTPCHDDSCDIAPCTTNYSSLNPITPPRYYSHSDTGQSSNPPLQTVDYNNQLNPMMSPLTPPKILGHDNRHGTMELDSSSIGLPHLRSPDVSLSNRKGILKGNGFINNQNVGNANGNIVHFDSTTPMLKNKHATRNKDCESPPATPLISNTSSSQNYSAMQTIAETTEHSSKSLFEGYHAQALLLSLAFFFLWTPQNLLAPNLTQAAIDFGYGNDTRARDLYLGSNLALASSVLSLPFSAFIGFASDVVPSRRTLISATALIGGMSSIGTAMANTYPQLIFARFMNGACMSGSVPVVFSLLSDWFDDEERNAASSGFTAMMGAGIILGQVYAGWTGPMFGWRWSFYVSGIMTMIMSVLVMVFVRDPVRGGKERVLREMMAVGRKYDRKLTWSQFVSAMTNHSSNCLLMLQGFFSNIPWGVMFVFLNDYLSQEKGLTVESATFIVAVFGVGCAVGGILGGYLGQLASRSDRSYLPIFMAVTTFFGMTPFLALLNDESYDHAGWIPCLYSFSGGCIASLPSVNIRPCIINVNPPEIRGAALTTANLIINSARGIGPTCLTSMISIWGIDRAYGFNILVSALKVLCHHDQTILSC